MVIKTEYGFNLSLAFSERSERCAQLPKRLLLLRFPTAYAVAHFGRISTATQNPALIMCGQWAQANLKPSAPPTARRSHTHGTLRHSASCTRALHQKQHRQLSATPRASSAAMRCNSIASCLRPRRLYSLPQQPERAGCVDLNLTSNCPCTLALEQGAQGALSRSNRYRKTVQE